MIFSGNLHMESGTLWMPVPIESSFRFSIIGSNRHNSTLENEDNFMLELDCRGNGGNEKQVVFHLPDFLRPVFSNPLLAMQET